MKDIIFLTIDDAVIDEYSEYYFSLHPKAHKRPIPHPYHESINEWMIMKRPMMNALKQKWKDFIVWFIKREGYDNLRVNRCEISQYVFFPTKRRRDIDNVVPKFILDGFVESGFIEDDSCDHVLSLTMKCKTGCDCPRTVFMINVL